MKNIKIFIELTRLNRPIGFMLLFWPCSWGLVYSSKINTSFDKFIYFFILFFLGSVLMRSAGCIINDIVDRDIDKKVNRTKLRPIASKKISIQTSIIYATLLCLIAFLILVQFNFFTIALGMGSMILAFSYPFMKRFTYWPQLFLGITFNWGILMAFAAVNNYLDVEILLIYFSAIFWTLGYDTIYGLQDIVDDEIIGMKSTSIKFKDNPKKFVSFCYLVNLVLLLYIFAADINNILSIFVMVAYTSILIFQIFYFDIKKPKTCMVAFKLNNFNGLLLFFFILIL